MEQNDDAILALSTALSKLDFDVQAKGRLVTVDGRTQLRPVTDAEDLDRKTVLVEPHRSLPPHLRNRFATEGAGWLDRNHLRLRTEHLAVDVDIDATGTTGRPERALRVLAGRAVAAVTFDALISWPEPVSGVRALARRAGVSPGGVSLAVRRLVDAGLLTDDRRATADLFWTAAAEWRPQWVEGHLPPGLGAVSVSDAAAAALGAPVAAGPDTPARYLTRIRTPPAPATSDHNGTTREMAAPAPTPIIVGDDGVADITVVALVIATDRGRGTEIVENWRGDHVWN